MSATAVSPPVPRRDATPRRLAVARQRPAKGYLLPLLGVLLFGLAMLRSRPIQAVESRHRRGVTKPPSPLGQIVEHL
jgi:hypothetical protein